jgi:phosphoribosylglycinamide formyltransferase 1
MGGRVAVLASGEGTNLQALLDDPAVGPSILLVVSDREDAPALGRARRAAVETLVLGSGEFPGSPDYDRALVNELQARAVDCVALAGFMRILGPDVVRVFAGRMLNVHPSLLPAFPGARSVADALAYGVKVTGVTVHLVSEEVDAGPILLQEPVPILPDDDWASLEARVHQVEHRLLPRAVRAMLEGRVYVDERGARIEGEPG